MTALVIASREALARRLHHAFCSEPLREGCGGHCETVAGDLLNSGTVRIEAVDASSALADAVARGGVVQ